MKIVKDRPKWWPTCPYPEDIFTMTREEYVKAVPDKQLRTAISGLLMRLGWEAASDAIYNNMIEEAHKRDK